jgi:hypothetical protein
MTIEQGGRLHAFVFSKGGSLPRKCGDCMAASRSAAPASSLGLTAYAAWIASLQSRSMQSTCAGQQHHMCPESCNNEDR